MKRVGGSRRKSRYKMRKSISERGKLPIKQFIQSLDEGQKVVLKPFSSYHGGLFCLRFQGRTGYVKGKQGECYIVEINDGGKVKNCVIHPVHLTKIA